MKAIVTCLIAFTSVAANAQAYSPPTFVSVGNVETPTMKRQKLERAVSLKEEAAALLARDGGKLTLVHQTYIRQKACAILGRKPVQTGNIALRNCQL